MFAKLIFVRALYKDESEVRELGVYLLEDACFSISNKRPVGWL